MCVLLVSDVHLCNKKPHVVNGFLNFLYNYAINFKALYILGDLFEVWIGDDDPNPLHIKISRALQYLRRHNVSCYFIHGNHDFLLGEKYASYCGMIILPQKKVLEFLGHRIVILHGDCLCTNKNFQRFYKYARKKWLQKIFLSLPIFLRKYISHGIQEKKNISTTINQKKIMKILFQTNTKTMIHGHFHTAKMYYKTISNKKKLTRVVLGNWNRTGSIIKIDKKGIHLIEFPFKH